MRLAVASASARSPNGWKPWPAPLAVAAGADSCRIARAGGKLVIEIPKPPAERKPLNAARLDQLEAPGPMAVPIGITTGGAIAWLDLADPNSCHVIIGGATGSGKSVLLS
jgi:DNA segregation ATPase FtsK/SpoIIIE, S-DNA-T family